MERDWPEDPQEYNRLDADLSEKDPADRDDTADNDIERRDTLTGIIESVEPSRTNVRKETIYGETDLNPNAEDQAQEHSATPEDLDEPKFP